MAFQYFLTLVALCAVGRSAPPPAPPRLYQQSAPAHLQAINTLDYFMDNPDHQQYYSQQLQKQASNPDGAPARLETLEPDSEVELIPGAQQPQQPPQQTPLTPGNGLIPGRVFIVQMPVPGYRPGTIGGYQPVYVVAAAPQGNTAYAPNGYQNAVLLNPSGHVLSPFYGYPGLAQQPIGNSGLLVGAPLNYPGLIAGREHYEQLYQGPAVPAFSYGPPGGPSAPQATPAGSRGVVQLSQLVSLQSQGQQNSPRASATAESSSNTDPKREGEADGSEESKESLQEAPEPRRNARPIPPHAQGRNKP